MICRYCFSFAKKGTSFLYGLCGIISLFVPLDWIFENNNHTFLGKLVAIVVVLIAIFSIFYVIGIIFSHLKKKIKICSFNDNYSLYVEYGDLRKLCETNEDVNIVVPVNRCFDTIIDDNIIERNSVHGIIFRWLYDKKIDPKKLNNKIKKELKGKNCQFVDKDGNKSQYDNGTIVEIPIDNIHLFLLGFTYCNTDLRAHVSTSEYIEAVSKLIEYLNNRSQGKPVYMPVIGTGRAQLAAKHIIILKFIIQALQMYSTKISSDIHIVVYKDKKCQISITDLT